jgi:hypothetical protein
MGMCLSLYLCWNNLDSCIHFWQRLIICAYIQFTFTAAWTWCLYIQLWVTCWVSCIECVCLMHGKVNSSSQSYIHTSAVAVQWNCHYVTRCWILFKFGGAVQSAGKTAVTMCHFIDSRDQVLVGYAVRRILWSNILLHLDGLEKILYQNLMVILWYLNLLFLG